MAGHGPLLAARKLQLDELARLLAAQDAAEGLTDEDAVPDLPGNPVSAVGDLWILGSHK